MTKRDWVMKSTVAVMLSTSLLMGGHMEQAAANTQVAVSTVDIASTAKKLVGKPYKYQANGPSSFGSANLASYVYKQAGIKIGSTISALYKTGSSVSQTNVQAGDLVFFSSNGKGSPSYMGIYIGDDQYVYSSQGAGKVVLKSFSEFENQFVGARRVVDSTSVEKPDNSESSTSNSIANEVIANGEKYLGTKYKYGSSKDTTKTFDCSSFTQRVFKEAGITLPRDSRQQSTVGKTVSKKDLKKGDLIFMKSSSKGASNRITHVAIYAGNGKILHTYGSPGVTYSKFDGTNWEKRVVKIKRVI